MVMVDALRLSILRELRVDGLGLIASSLQRSDFGVHVGEDGGDGTLFGKWWERNTQGPNLTKVQPLSVTSRSVCLYPGGTP